MTNLIGKLVELPNGGFGIVQAFEEGRYTVIDGYGLGHARYLAPEELRLPADQEQQQRGTPALFDLSQYRQKPPA